MPRGWPNHNLKILTNVYRLPGELKIFPKQRDQQPDPDVSRYATQSGDIAHEMRSPKCKLNNCPAMRDIINEAQLTAVLGIEELVPQQATGRALDSVVFVELDWHFWLQTFLTNTNAIFRLEFLEKIY